MNTTDAAKTIRLARILCELRDVQPHEPASASGQKTTNLIVAERDVKLVLQAMGIDRLRTPAQQGQVQHHQV